MAVARPSAREKASLSSSTTIATGHLQPPRSHRNANILLWLLGLTVVYQICYQVVMHNKLQSEAESLDPCRSGRGAGDPQCVENRLFQSWQGSLQAGQAAHAAVSSAHEAAEEEKEQAAALELLAREEIDDATSRDQSALASWDSLPKQLQQAVKEEMEDDEEDSVLNGFVAVHSPIATPGEASASSAVDVSASPEAASTTAIPAAEAPEPSPAASSASRASASAPLLSKVAPSTAALAAGGSASAPAASAGAAEPPLELAPLLRGGGGASSSKEKEGAAAVPAAAPLLRSLGVANRWEGHQNTTGLTPWAIDLIALQERLEARMNGLMSVQKRLASEASPTSEERSLLGRIRDLGREMCEEPHRKGRPACAQFLEEHKGLESGRGQAASANESAAATVPAPVAATNQTLLIAGAARRQRRAESAERRELAAKRAAALDQRLKELAAGRKAWELLVSNRIVAFGKELCADLRRSGYPSCAPFLGVGKFVPAVHAAENATQPLAGSPLTPSPPQLHWREVVAWPTNGASRHNSSLAVVTREQLRRAKWGGMIPKVACVTAIPSGSEARARMKYFINNFRLQSYEGPRQLILVHHKNDTEAARLVKPYADGSYIKAVAAQGNEAVFPSTTALRFGAWASDGDVIARWDFDEWHHPQRLSMQVRALALTNRPACLLRQWTVLEESGREARILSGHLGWEGSLVGEASWMREHWHPLLEEERAVLGGAQAHRVVQVDMAELSVYNAGSQDWASILKHFGPAVDDVVVTSNAANQTAAEQGAKSIVEALKTNSTVQLLELDGNNLSDEGVMLQALSPPGLSNKE